MKTPNMTRLAEFIEAALLDGVHDDDARHYAGIARAAVSEFDRLHSTITGHVDLIIKLRDELAAERRRRERFAQAIATALEEA